MLKQFSLSIVKLVVCLFITGEVLERATLFAGSSGFHVPDIVIIIVIPTCMFLVASWAMKDAVSNIREQSRQQLAFSATEQAAARVNAPSKELTGRLTVRRTTNRRTREVAYQLLLDNALLGHINDGEMRDFDVPPGEHELCMRVDWAETKPLRLSLARGEQKYFDCGSVLDSARQFLLVWYITFGRRYYLWLRERLPANRG